MKRILHITGTMDRAGAETMVMNLYRAIDRNKYQFDFLYFTDKKCDFDDEIERLGGKIYRIIERNPLKRMTKTTRLLKQNPQWQIVHAHTLFSIGFHLRAAKKAGVKQRFAHAHSTNDVANDSFVGKLYKILSLKMIRKYATSRLACGIAAAEYLYSEHQNITIIPNSIDIETFSEIGENERDYLKKEFQLERSAIVLLQLGRLNKIKNHEFSIAIAHELKKSSVDFKLFFAGQGNLREDLVQRIKEQGLENEIVFLGLRTDVAQLLAGSDLMLMPSLYEGFPVVLVESQAAGTPALIADTISPEVDLEVGLVNFESLNTNPEVWAKKVAEIIYKRILNKEERIQKLKEQGFDIYTNAKFLEKLYAEE